MAVFLSSPARYAQSVLDGISLWAACVLPAVFPFLFLTALLTALPPFSAFSKKFSPVMGKIFRISGAGGGAAILAALSGYPVGARLLCDLSESGAVAREEKFRLACLATTSGPMFLVGSVGCMMYRSMKAGAILLFCHLLSVWTVCFLLRFSAKRTEPVPPPPPARQDGLLYDSLYRAVISILCVGGLIALFSCFGQMLADLGLFRLLSFGPCSEGVLRGLLEMTSGCAALAELGTPLSLACACALVTFGGMCVLCQQATYLVRAGVSMPKFLLVKCLQAALAFGLCLAAGVLFL